MGIRNLNSFLQKNASNAIKSIPLKDLSGKKIAVDVSIYMYKFLYHNSLIESIYLMLSVFRTHNITPIFVFDGKAPEEKRELINQRNSIKVNAEDEYNKLNELLQDDSKNAVERKDIMHHMKMLKKRLISVKRSDIDTVKQLIQSCGATYYDAPGEADVVCALLTIENKVWACLSEDTDMFVYGCPRVLRYLNLATQTVSLYDFKKIVNKLKVSPKEFREICVLSGTDYNCNREISLYTCMDSFKKYKEANTHMDFYDWIQTQEQRDVDIDSESIQRVKQICTMFDLKNSASPDFIQTVRRLNIANRSSNQSEIEKILKADGFIFPPKNDL